jgi:hypothetical protein
MSYTGLALGQKIWAGGQFPVKCLDLQRSKGKYFLDLCDKRYTTPLSYFPLKALCVKLLFQDSVPKPSYFVF